MTKIVITGEATQKVSVDTYRFIEAMIDDFLGYYRHWVSEKNGAYYIMGDNRPGPDITIREITKEEKEYYDALIVVKRFVNKQRDLEIKNQRDFEEFKSIERKPITNKIIKDASTLWGESNPGEWESGFRKCMEHFGLKVDEE